MWWCLFLFGLLFGLWLLRFGFAVVLPVAVCVWFVVICGGFVFCFNSVGSVGFCLCLLMCCLIVF